MVAGEWVPSSRKIEKPWLRKSDAGFSAVSLLRAVCVGVCVRARACVLCGTGSALTPGDAVSE